MTPERIEEIKQLISKHKHFDKRMKMTKSYNEKDNSVIRLNHIESRAFEYIPDLLAALEESQQQLTNSLERERGLKRLCNQSLEEKETTKHELVEAQQTIAQQLEREQSIIYEVSEIHKESAAGNNGSLDRADTALKRIILLSSNLLALGNKEGTAIPVTPNCPTCGNQHPINHPSRPGIYLCVPCDYVYEEGSDKS